MVLVRNACLWRMSPRLTGAGQRGQEGVNYRVPPAWPLEHEAPYSSRAWCQDPQVWMISTSLQPHQQAATMVMRLGGSAWGMVRTVAPQGWMNSGVINGRRHYRATYITVGSQQRFEQLDDDSGLVSIGPGFYCTPT